MFSTRALLLALAPLAASVPVPAHADPLPVSDVVAFYGTKATSPGYPCSPCRTEMAFNAVVAGDDAAALFAGCIYEGTSSGTEDALSGAGSATVTGCGISGVVTYTRLLGVTRYAGSLTVDGACHFLLDGVSAATVDGLEAGTWVLVDC
jgi:hypothetical protein